jgi:hypothetical protein
VERVVLRIGYSQADEQSVSAANRPPISINFPFGRAKPLSSPYFFLEATGRRVPVCAIKIKIILLIIESLWDCGVPS